jgi:hypothetical protein
MVKMAKAAKMVAVKNRKTNIEDRKQQRWRASWQRDGAASKTSEAWRRLMAWPGRISVIEAMKA